jgi:uncharacterized protein (TIGR02145 family)
MNFITRFGRTLSVLAAVVAVGLSGCEDNGANNGGGVESSYESVTIGGMKWMKKNLNIETTDSWCHEDSTANCDKYGRLYTWAAAKTVCPSGWRLPDTADWNKLEKAAGGRYSAGKKLKATSGWAEDNGTDDFGFSALPGGFRGSDDNFYGARGGRSSGRWWTATENGSDFATSKHMRDIFSDVEEGIHDKSSGYSVRCVQDE